MCVALSDNVIRLVEGRGHMSPHSPACRPPPRRNTRVGRTAARLSAGDSEQWIKKMTRSETCWMRSHDRRIDHVSPATPPPSGQIASTGAHARGIAGVARFSSATRWRSGRPRAGAGVVCGVGDRRTARCCGRQTPAGLELRSRFLCVTEPGGTRKLASTERDISRSASHRSPVHRKDDNGLLAELVREVRDGRM